MKAALAAVLLSLAWMLPAAADAPGIVVEQAWARASAGNQPTGVVYVTLRNTGQSDDVLTGAATSVAARAELHESMMSGMTMQMAPLSQLVIPAGGTVELKPGGKHIMLIGLKAPLVAGQSFVLTLKFKTAGSRDVKVDIRGIGTMDPMH